MCIRISCVEEGNAVFIYKNRYHVHISLRLPSVFVYAQGSVLSCECAHQLYWWVSNIPTRVYVPENHCWIDSKMFKKCFVKTQVLIYMDQFDG